MNRLFSVVFFALLSLSVAMPQLAPDAQTTIAAQQSSILTDERIAVTLADGSAIENLITNRANGMPIITHTRIFELGQIREENNRVENFERKTASFNATAETLTIGGTMYGQTAIEDVRLLELDGTLHVLRDIYLSPTDETVYTGRNLPVLLSEEGDAAPKVDKLGAYSIKAALASASITGLGGDTNTSAGISNGRVAMSCGSTYNGSMVANDQDSAYAWIVNGANFGTAVGNVTLAGRTARNISWTGSQIKAAPTVPYNWGPMSTLLTIKTAAGASATYGVGIVPAIRTRIYGQCTWYVAQTRLNMGKQPSPSAYGGYSNITTSYIPQVGDQYQWNAAHTAIVLQVSGPAVATGGYKTWTLTVGEYNSRCTNQYNSYTTQFQVRTSTTGTVVTKYPQSSVTSYGSASLYYR